MKILLNTQILLWSLNGSGRFPASFTEPLNSAVNELYVSAASLWEIAIKLSNGKLIVPGGDAGGFFPLAQEAGAQLLPLLPKHFVELKSLPKLHHDLFDRMILCQAITEGMSVATVDAMMLRYDVAFLQ